MEKFKSQVTLVTLENLPSELKKNGKEERLTTKTILKPSSFWEVATRIINQIGLSILNTRKKLRSPRTQKNKPLNILIIILKYMVSLHSIQTQI